MTDRDTFAAAALTGLLARVPVSEDDDSKFPPEVVAPCAYRWADAMLAERANTDHDAVPAARAPAHPHVRRDGASRADAEPDGCGAVAGTGNTPEPVAWAVMYPGGFCIGAVALHKHLAEERAAVGDTVVPLYAHPPQDRVAQLEEAIRRLADQDATLSVQGGNVIVEMTQDRVVRLPKAPDELEISEANGYAAALRDTCAALDAAGVKWEVAQ